MSHRRIAITRALANTPRGKLSLDGFAREPSPFPEITRFSIDDFPIKHAAIIEGEDQTELALQVTQEALQQHFLSNQKTERLGIFVGAEPERVRLENLAKAQSATTNRSVLHATAYDERSPARLTQQLMKRFQTNGPSGTFSMACAASASAIANAFYSIKRGDCERAICVGAALNVEPLLFAGFCLLRAMSPSGKCQPFSQHRDGFVLGDGVGCLLLETEDLLRQEKREHEILGFLEGVGESLDAYRITDPEPTGKGAKSAIEQALYHARRSANEVALVKAHATGTLPNDRVEANVIAALFPHEPAVLAIKGSIGHSIAACGLIEMIAALSSLKHQKVEGCYGMTTFDNSLPLINIQKESRSITGNLALCNTFGFGGINCALLVSV